MPDEDEDFHTQRIGTWQILPRWVKGATLLIGLPALLVFIGGLLLGDIGSRTQMFAFALFLGVAVLQGFFVARAYVRMDL